MVACTTPVNKPSTWLLRWQKTLVRFTLQPCGRRVRIEVHGWRRGKCVQVLPLADARMAWTAYLREGFVRS